MINSFNILGGYMSLYLQMRENVWAGASGIGKMSTSIGTHLQHAGSWLGRTFSISAKMVKRECVNNQPINTQNNPLTTEIKITDVNKSDKSQNPAKEETSDSLKAKINRAFWAGLGCWSTYNLADAGLARLFALETLTHGTGPLGYIGISLNGADPNYGGGKTGSSVVAHSFYVEKSKNFFYVFKDTEFNEAPCNDTLIPILCSTLGNQILARRHAVLSGMANFGYSTVYNTGNAVQGVLGALAGFFTPTLKFRFIPEEVVKCNEGCRFEDDPDYNRAAYRTSQAIKPHHLGFSGTISQGINAQMFNRMYNNPAKVLLGIALLGAAGIMAKKTYRYIKSEKSVPPQTINRPMTCFQKGKRKLKVLAVKSCWTTLAITAICLNTL